MPLEAENNLKPNLKNKSSGAQGELSLLVRKNSIFVLAQKIFTPFLYFFFSVYIVRKLTIEAYGVYNVLGTVMDYVALFAALGLPSVYQRFIPEFLINKEKTKINDLVIRGFRWSLAAALIIILIILLFSNHLGILLKIKNYLGLFAIWSPGIILYLEAVLLETALTSLFLHKYFLSAQVVYSIFRLGIIFYFLSIGLDLKGLIIGEVLAYGLLFFLQLYYYRRYFSGQLSGPIKSKMETKRILRYGGFSYFNEMGAKILENATDLIIISAFLGTGPAGVYAFANNTMNLFSRAMPHKVFREIIRPAFFFKYAKTKDKTELEALVNMITKFIGFFYFPLLTGVLVLGDKIIFHIFDPKYSSSLYLLWIIASFTALNAFQFPLGMVVQAIEKPEINFYSKIFSVYNIAINILVIKKFGMIGVALGTGTAILFKNLFIYFLAKKYVSLSIDFKAIGRIIINSLVMGILVFGLRGVAVNSASLLGVVLIGGMAYFLISYLNKIFSVQERGIINKILPRPLFIF